MFTIDGRDWGLVSDSEPEGVGLIVRTARRESIEKLNSAIHVFSADINAAASSARTGDDEARRERLTAYQTRWTAYVMRWNDWYADEGQSWFPDAEEFAALRSEYDLFYEEFEAMGETTRAPPTTEIPPAGPPPSSSEIPWGTVALVGAMGVGAYWLATGGAAAISARARRQEPDE